MSEENSEGGITTPLGSVQFKGKKTAEFIAIFCLSLLLLLSYILWEHKADAKQAEFNITSAIKEFTVAQREQTAVQRTANCLIATKESERREMFQTCERNSR